MIKFLAKSNEKIAAVIPKILKWNFKKNKKTKIWDSAGIKILDSGKAIDKLQNKVDEEKIKKPKTKEPLKIAVLI